MICNALMCVIIGLTIIKARCSFAMLSHKPTTFEVVISKIDNVIFGNVNNCKSYTNLSKILGVTTLRVV